MTPSAKQPGNRSQNGGAYGGGDGHKVGGWACQSKAWAMGNLQKAVT